MQPVITVVEQLASVAALVAASSSAETVENSDS